MKSTRNLCSQVALVALLGAVPALVSACSTTQSASRQIEDSEITAKVKSKFIGSTEVAAHDIDVNTEEGVVYLLGRVKSENEKRAAERIARETEGVKRVVNHLEVGDKT